MVLYTVCGWIVLHKSESQYTIYHIKIVAIVYYGWYII